jgi:DNA-binding transcriptional LysR family regulator
LLAAAEEGMGFALARWSIVARSLQKGTLKLAGTEVVPYGSAYYFVCPVPYLAIPKVAQFREWVLSAAREFPPPPVAMQPRTAATTAPASPKHAKRASKGKAVK